LETYITKLKHILPTFLAVTSGTVLGLGFIRWLFCLQFSIIDIKEEIWVLWLPLIFPWIPITLWLRQRFRILTFKGDTDKGRFFFQIISWGVLTAMLFVSQGYLTTATGRLKELSTIKDIDKTEKSRYYKLTNFSVAPNYGGSFTNFRTSGKYNEDLNFDVYFVIPILKDTSETFTVIPKYWYGVKFKEQISNKISISFYFDIYKINFFIVIISQQIRF
jgi:rhomboid protease GluP